MFICGFTYKQKASPGLGPQSKDWKKRLRLGPLVPTGLTQDRGHDSVFRKGLIATNALICFLCTNYHFINDNISSSAYGQNQICLKPIFRLDILEYDHYKALCTHHSPRQVKLLYTKDERVRGLHQLSCNLADRIRRPSIPFFLILTKIW